MQNKQNSLSSSSEEIKLMTFYLEEQKEHKNYTPIKRGESTEFDAFKDTQFFKKKHESSESIQNKHKIISSLNVLMVTHQPKIQKIPFQQLNKHKSTSLYEPTHQLQQFQPEKEAVSNVSLKLTTQRKIPCQPNAPRYTRTTNSQIKFTDCSIAEQQQIKQDNNKINVLKKIIEHYNSKSIDHCFQSNLICIDSNINRHSSLSSKHRLIAVSKMMPRQIVKKYPPSSHKKNELMNDPTKITKKDFDFFHHYFDQTHIHVEAQGLNELIKINQKHRKQASKSVNSKEPLKKQKYQRKITFSAHPQKKTEPKFQTLPTEKLKYFQNPLTDTSISIKVNKFRQFLFMINLANSIYRQLDIHKYEQPFKIFIGKGNNSNLIKAIMKRRFWFEYAKNIQEAQFVWTQLKQETVYDAQKLNFEQKKIEKQEKEQLKEQQNTIKMTVQEQIANTRNTISEQLNLQADPLQVSNIRLQQKIGTQIRTRKQLKQKKIKQKQRYNDNLQTQSKILTETQLQQLKQLISEFAQRKRHSFNDRMHYLKNINFSTKEETSKQIIHNHLPANGLLGNKKAMFYMLRQYYRLHNKDIFTVVPLTFHIKKQQDEQYKQFISKFIHNRLTNRHNHWIVKPGQFSNRGQGISCTNKLEHIKTRISKLKTKKQNKSLIVQQYITNPLLYNGRKFDIRTYMLITINNQKLRAYWYHEGYVRTSSYTWTLEDLNDNEIHLTNDAIQKYSYNYGKYEPGNKLTYSELQRHFDSLPKHNSSKLFDFSNSIHPKLKQIATEAVKACFCFIDPERNGNNFELFGFDFMLDNDYKPWLIEINTNPCLEMTCPVLNRIIPSLIENTFRIGLDPIIPPPLNYSSNYKYSIPENALHYNKFQLIFDEDRDSPPLLQLYQNSSVIKQIDEYEQDKQIYEQQGQQLDLQQA